MNSALRSYLVLGGVALAALFVLTRKGVAFEVAKGAAGAAVDLADGVLGGVVVGVGEVVGVPETDADQCAADLEAGRTWAASFSCPAGRWLKGTLGIGD